MQLKQTQKNYLLGAIATVIIYAYASIRYWLRGGNMFLVIGSFVVILIIVAIIVFQAKKHPDKSGVLINIMVGMGFLFLWNIFLFIENIINHQAQDTFLYIGMLIITAIYFIFSFRDLRHSSLDSLNK